MIELRSILWRSLGGGRTKQVALELVPDRSETDATSELAKILGPRASRGDRTIRAIELALQHGDREVLRAYFDRMLRGTPADELAAIREDGREMLRQIELFAPRVVAMNARIDRVAEVIDLEAALRRRGS